MTNVHLIILAVDAVTAVIYLVGSLVGELSNRKNVLLVLPCLVILGFSFTALLLLDLVLKSDRPYFLYYGAAFFVFEFCVIAPIVIFKQRKIGSARDVIGGAGRQVPEE